MIGSHTLCDRLPLVAIGGLLSITCASAVQADELALRVSSLARSARGIEVSEIGRSGEGRPIEVIRLMRPGIPEGERPALLVVGGLHPLHRVGPEVAVGVAESVWMNADPELLERHVLYVVPRLNPDGASWLADPDNPLMDLAGVIGPYDNDHDRRTDEDPVRDLNGDGRITLMRLRNPSVSSGLGATHAADKDEPRLLKEADAAEGERREFALLTESSDLDGDGAFGEDGIDGVVPDRNFPNRWPEFEPAAGRYQLSSPEARSMVDWMLAHDNIVCVLTFGPNDTIINVPVSGKQDETGTAPLGIEGGDEDVWKAIGKLFVKTTGMTSDVDGGPDAKGAFHRWAYAQFGVLSFSTPVWVRPDLIDPKKMVEDDDEAADDEEDPDASDDDGDGEEDGEEDDGEDAEDDEPERWKPPKGASDDRAWLAYSDDLRDGAGFVEWTPFEHPQLGDVEIGGFVPGFRYDAPAGETDRLVAEQGAFVTALLGRMPRVEVDEPIVERLAGATWRVTVRIRNEGFLPTRAAIGIKARRIPPMVARIGVDQGRVVSGMPVQRIHGIDGYGWRDASWVIRGRAGEKVEIAIDSPVYGDRVVRVGLE